MKDLGLGKPPRHVPIKAPPCGAVLLATTAQGAEPEPANLPQEAGERAEVGRDRVIGKVATHDGLEPSSLLLDGSVRPSLQPVLDIPQFAGLSITPGFPLEQKLAGAGLPAKVREAQEGEAFRFAKATPLAIPSRKAAEFDEAGLARMKRRREGLQPLAQVRHKPHGVVSVLEADYEIVGITHDDHVAPGVALAPLMSPEIVDVVKVDIRKQRRNDALNAKGNFRFERQIVKWRDRPLVDLRRKR